MKIAVTGGQGLIGSALCKRLVGQGHEVKCLVRAKSHVGALDIFWNPEGNEIDLEQLEGLDAVVHLAGENIAARRWDDAQKRRIRESRIHGTKLLANSLIKLKSPPRTIASGSAIGFYGNRGK